MTTINTTELATSGNDFTLIRVFDAPRELVWKAWTDPTMLARWFGPHGFTCPVCRLDLRVGGAYRIVMRSPEGQDYPIKGSYLEVIAPERLVMTVDTSEHPPEWQVMMDEQIGGKAGDRPRSLVWTVTFAESAGRTALTVVNRFGSAAERDAHLKLGARDGWSQSFEKMDALLTQ